MLPVLISMFVFAFVGAISPGPVNVIATSAGARFGFARTLPHIMGATLTYTLIVFLTGIGLNKVLMAYPQITDALKYTGAAFLLYMSYQIAVSVPELSDDVDPLSEPPAFGHGALSQALNPKAWLVAMSGISLFVTTQSSPGLYLWLFCAISCFVCFIGVGSWAVAGHMIRGYLSNVQRQVIFNRLMGGLLSLTVVVIF